jgi:hypothetical protein
MQILSVRNAELSTINNDMMRELQGRKDAKVAPAAPSSSFNAGMLTSFTGKMRRQRQMSGGSQQELKAQNLVAGSNESTLSFVSTSSDGAPRSQQGSKGKKEDRQEDIFGEEIVAPKKFNWKKGTINTMNSMFGKLLVEAPGGQADAAANGKAAPPMLSDNGSSNGQILPPTRSFSGGSDNRSLNGQFTEQHSFIMYNFMKPTRCDCCDDKIWGREYRCRGKYRRTFIPIESSLQYRMTANRQLTIIGAYFIVRMWVPGSWTLHSRDCARMFWKVQGLRRLQYP